MDAPIRAAVILAAGSGERLRPYTDNIPKGLVEVNGRPLLAHTIGRLEQAGFERVWMVSGYKANALSQWLNTVKTSLRIDLVHNASYATTNNITSLAQALSVVEENFVLIESDLILGRDALARMQCPDRMALSPYNPRLHRGTTVVLDAHKGVERVFVAPQHPPNLANLYKTVNLTSFSAGSVHRIREEVARLISQGRTDVYYEMAIANTIASGSVRFKASQFDAVYWDEVDTPEDLYRVRAYLAHKDLVTDLA